MRLTFSRALFIQATLLLCLVHGGALAQRPGPYMLSEKDFPSATRNFPMSEAYDIQLDSVGHVFFAGVRGVQRFNGEEMHLLLPDSALRVSFCVDLFKDAQNGLWVTTTGRGLGMITEDSVISYKYNEAFKPYWRAGYESCHLDVDGKMHIGFRGKGYFTVSALGDFTEILGKSSGINGFVITELEDGTLFHFSILQPSAMLDEGQKLLLYYLNETGKLDTITTLDGAGIRYKSSLLSQLNGGWVFSDGISDIVWGKEGSLIDQHLFPHYVINLFEDSFENLWIGTLNRGIFKVHNQLFDQAMHLLDGSSSAVVAESEPGSLWIKTNQNFFRYIPDLSLGYYDPGAESSIPVTSRAIVSDSNRVFILDGSNRITCIAKDSIFAISAPMLPLTEGMRELEQYPRGLYYDTNVDLLYAIYYTQLAVWDGELWESIVLDNEQFAYTKTRQIQGLSDGSFAGVTRKNLFHVQENKVHVLVKSNEELGDLNCLATDSTGSFWLGTSTGLWKWSDGKYSRPVISRDFQSAFQSNITLITAVGTRVWVQTETAGLIEINGAQQIQLLGKNGEPIFASEHFLSGDKEVWTRASDRTGVLIRLRPQGDSTEISEFTFDDHAGFFDWFIGTLAITNEQVYWGSSNGVFRIALEELETENSPPRTYVKQVFSDHKLLSKQKSYDLTYDQNSINLVFEAISYRSEPPQMRLRLLGLDSTWTLPRYGAIQYTNLDPGSYQFQLQARSYDEPWGPMEEVRFLIRTPYWQTWWFRTLMLVALIAVIGFTFRLWYGVRDRQNKLQLDGLKAEQKALRAQMNPHFIFNALSSIQELTLNNQRMVAVENIASFAKLIRRILVQSGKESISLQEEIATLELYLGLESLRFDGGFSYAITVGEGIVADQQNVPTMILQPFIENAIKHGLLKRNPPGGHIAVSFESKAGLLLCVIEDNGIGRKKSEELKVGKKSLHRSFGIDSVRERLQLLNTERNATIELQLIDLFDVDQQPVGTRIELLIP